MADAIHLGLCIPKGKRSRMGFPDLIRDACQLANIRLTEVNSEGDLERQGPFHVLLHKVLDYHNELCADIANTKINELMNYCNTHREMIVIDDFDWCLKLTNRKSMHELFKSCEFTLNNIKVFLPNTIEIDEVMTSTEIEILLSMTRVKFPIISKSFSAYFDDGAHDMYLLFSSGAFSNMPKPCLLQEFCHHGGVLYKIFVVGNQFHICERPSIRDMDENIPINQMIHFDSFRVSKIGKTYEKNLHKEDPNRIHWRNCDEVDNLLDSTVVQELISRIHDQTGLYLYGVDILIEKETGNYALIDINQFPSYSGIGQNHFSQDLVRLIRSFFDAS